MEQISAFAGPIGTILSASGSVSEGLAAGAQGKAQRKLAEAQARQMEINAGQQLAVGQRASAERLRESELLQSRALAVAAASGGGAMDPTVLRLIGGIAEEGALAAGTERFNAEEAARAMRDEAKGTRYSGILAEQQGKRARFGKFLQAGSTILSGVDGFKKKVEKPDKDKGKT